LLTERFLRRVDKTRIVADELRRSVSFVHGNLVDKNFLAGERPFDLIFCRNVLIYFHTIGRKSALENLRRLLDDEGVLYVGHSEAGVMRVADFEVADAQFPFSFRKKVAVERGRNSEPNLFDLGSTSARILPFVSTPAAKNSAPAGAKSSAAVPTKVVTLPTVAGSTNQPLTSTSSSAAESKTRSQTGVDAVSLIEQARSAADRGDLDAAEKLCLRSLEANSLDAGGQSLLGIIRKARGDLRAANQAFEQALYLDPDHLEALTHLFLDAERRGDRTSADRLRRRLDRIGSNDRRGDR
jgi:chemotaxis protein methyltransferase WspC